jgi:GxxExxY protein
MASKLVSTPYDEITYQIIGCAMNVHRALGPGMREDSYQRALASKLADAQIPFEEQKNYEVFEDSRKQFLIGYYIPDFVVDGKIIVEIKALGGLDNRHVAQVIGYLAVSGCPIGLLINFGERSLRQRRILPPKNVAEILINRQWLHVPAWLKPEMGDG